MASIEEEVKENLLYDKEEENDNQKTADIPKEMLDDKTGCHKICACFGKILMFPVTVIVLVLTLVMYALIILIMTLPVVVL